MDKLLHILILEDNAADAELMEYELKEAGFAFTSRRVMTEDAFLQALEEFSPDVILSDYDLPLYNGASALAEAKKRYPEIPFILVTGAVSEDRAIEILTSGARDYVLKHRLNRLAPAVQRAILESEEHKARKRAEKELHLAHKDLERKIEERTAALQEEIAERRRVEQELRESEERFRSAFDYGAVPMVMTALDFTLIRVNAAYAAMLGYSESELAGMNFMDFTHPEDIPANKAGLAPVMSGEKKTFRMEKRYIRKDSRIVWVVMSTSFVRDSEGKPLYLITHAQDITERKNAEEKLKRSEAGLREAQKLARIGSWDWDCETGEVRWSDEMYAIHGVDPQTLIDIPGEYLNLVHPDDRKSVADSVMLSQEECKPSSMKYRIVLPDGSVRRVQSQGEIVAVDETGKPARMIGTIQDITEREQAEEMIRALLDAPRDLVCLCDAEGKVILPNKAFAHSLEKDSSELIGRHITQILPSEIGVRRWKYAKEAIEKGKVIQFEDERNGRWFHNVIYPILNVQGKTEKIAGFAQEITEKKRIAEELEQRTAQLEDANRDMEAFIYSVSHDLQAPIRAMDGFTKMILKEYGPAMDDAFRKRFDRVRENAQRMADLIQALLNLSRIGRRKMTASRVDMKEMFDHVWDDLQGEYDGREIEFTLGDLPPAFGDRALIRQAVFNLLANAVKFTARREKAVIRVGSRTENGNTIYFVMDNGAGFDMAHSGKLFQAFKRLHSSSDYEGTGIGLAIVQRIINRHGGKVWAEGEVGKGATFYFTLPQGSSGPAWR